MSVDAMRGVFCERNSSHSFSSIDLKLSHGLKMSMWFGHYRQIFFFIFLNL